MNGRAIHAGLLYCAVVFAAGFGLGVVRTILIIPLAGELTAVGLEAPVMLAVSWGACGWVLDRFELPPRFLDRLVMGGVALVLLILAETFVAVLARRFTVLEYLGSHSEPAVLLGLLAQLAFAIFPFVQRRNARG